MQQHASQRHAIIVAILRAATHGTDIPYGELWPGPARQFLITSIHLCRGKGKINHHYGWKKPYTPHFTNPLSNIIMSSEQNDTAPPRTEERRNTSCKHIHCTTTTFSLVGQAWVWLVLLRIDKSSVATTNIISNMWHTRTVLHADHGSQPWFVSHVMLADELMKLMHLERVQIVVQYQSWNLDKNYWNNVDTSWIRKQNSSSDS